MTPVEFIDDANIPLFAVNSPEAIIVVLSNPPVVFINPLILTVVPVIPAVAFIEVTDKPD